MIDERFTGPADEARRNSRLAPAPRAARNGGRYVPGREVLAAQRLTMALLDLLSGQRRGDLGDTAEAVARVQAEPAQLDELFDAFGTGDAALRTAAMRVLVRATEAHPEWLEPYRDELLGPYLAGLDQWDVRAGLCRLWRQLQLGTAERRRLCALAESWLGESSRVVQVWALHCLVDLSAPPALAAERARAERHLAAALRHEAPAMRARARILAKRLARERRAASAAGRGSQR